MPRSEPHRYLARCPGFGVAGAEFLIDELPQLREIGMDVPSHCRIESLDETIEAHNALLTGEARRFLIIEDMDLERDLANLIEILLVPWMIEGVDSVPCAVLGVLHPLTRMGRESPWR